MVESLDRLLAVHPAYAEAHNMRGMLMADFNRSADALASYEKAVALKPDYSKARWGSCMAALPILYAEQSEIAAQRADYERRLRALRSAYEAGQIPGDLSKGVGMAQPFFLAYQGYNDRELQSLFGGLAARIMTDRYGTAELTSPPAPGERIRVGIVTAFFYQHSVWKVGVRGWVSQLDPQRFEVIGYHTGPTQDPETALATSHCHRFVQGPNSTGTLEADHRSRPAARADLSGNRNEPGRGGTGRASPRADAMHLHRPSADQRIPHNRLFPQRRIDRADRWRRALLGKAREASQHRLPL